MLGARLYAMVNCFMLIFWPHLLVSSVRGVSFGGVATRVLQRCWMCEEGGFAGWYGRWKKSCDRVSSSFVVLVLGEWVVSLMVSAFWIALRSRGRIVEELWPRAMSR